MDYLKQLLIAFNLKRVLHLSNAFQLGSNQVTWNDYDPTLSLDITNRAITTTSSNALSLGSSSGQLTLGNLTNAANATGDL